MNYTARTTSKRATEELILAVLERSSEPLSAGAIAGELGQSNGTGVGKLLRRLEKDGQAFQLASYPPWQWVAGNGLARAVAQSFRILRNFYGGIEEPGAQEMSLLLTVDEQRYRRAGMVVELKQNHTTELS